VPRNFAVAFAAAALAVSTSPFVIIAAAQDAPPVHQPPSEAHARRPMPKPTNLQVLSKSIAVPDLLALMRSYTGALGVECEFCHATDPATHRPNYASDANSDKAIARTMIAMTNEINAKYLSQVKDPDATPAEKTVTCGTCHRGNSMPAPFGPVPKMGDKMSAHHDDDQAPPSEKKPE
jgi:hypothetical protein